MVINENKIFSVDPKLSARVTTATIHLFQGLDGYGESEVWCGAISFSDNSQDVAQVNCVECLTATVQLGRDANKRLAAIQPEASVFGAPTLTVE